MVTLTLLDLPHNSSPRPLPPPPLLVPQKSIFFGSQVPARHGCLRGTVCTIFDNFLQTKLRCLGPYGNAAASEKLQHSSAKFEPALRQEVLWKGFFSDPTQWWDIRQDRKSSRQPDFSHKWSKEALWLDNQYKPAWVDSHLARWDARVRELRRSSALVGGRAHVTTEEAQVSEAVNTLDLMLQQGCYVDDFVFYGALKRCIGQKNLELGKRLHALILKSQCSSHAFLANQIIRMYSTHGMLEEAMQVFTKVAVPDTFVWASIIKAYSEQGQPKQAIALYRNMRDSSVQPNRHIFVAVLKACAAALDLASGNVVHADILDCAVKVDDVFVGSSLVDMYAKCGSLDDACRVFHKLHHKNVVTWTAMIGAFSQHGLNQEALALYASMQQEGITSPNRVTFVCLLKACASARALPQGKLLHCQIQERGLEVDVSVGNSLVDMYAKCGSIGDACRVFNSLPTRDVVTWTAMIAGYAQHGLAEEALDLYWRMQQDGTSLPNSVTFACLLQACASVGALHQGKQLHYQIQGRGLEADIFLSSCIVDMYVKCGCLEDARRVFDGLPRKDLVTWTAMIAGYANAGLGREAISLYARMQHEGIAVADRVTFMCLLKACASTGALNHGKHLHVQILERGLEMDVVVGNCLVDMYAKCCSLVDARTVLDSMPTTDVVTWNSLLNGYAEHGNGSKAMQCFAEMRQTGVEPNGITFISLLVACSHEGLVEEGQMYFNMMVHDYGIAPTICHYNCMVDLLGRSGHLDEAETMLQTMPFEIDVVGCTSLLSACKSHGDIERGRQCFDRLTALLPHSATPYLLLGHIYGAAGRWRDVDMIESMRRSAGAWKKPAKACIEVNSKVLEFTVGEERADISPKLTSMNVRLTNEGGHVPHTEAVLEAVSHCEKVDALCGHAEKLALSYGLLNTAHGAPLLVTKNLRMCNDCHSATKILSRLEKREIIVRDAHRVHHFMAGSCSCNDRP